MKRPFIIVVGVVLVSFCTFCTALIAHLRIVNQRAAQAHAQVTRWAERLHSQTTDAGVYVRHPGKQLDENDPWGTPLSVGYAQGGFAETVTVRSAGPDRTFYTEDDIVAQRSVVNLKGIGTGAKESVEDFAQKGARGLTKGAAEGIKETIRDALAGEKPIERKKQ
jgi:hypothetical protein